MYKSFGNTLRIRDITKKIKLKYFKAVSFSKHYREPLVFLQPELHRFCSIDETIACALWGNAISKKPDFETKLINEFTSYIDDDVNTPPALELTMETARSRHSLTDLRSIVGTFGLVYY